MSSIPKYKPRGFRGQSYMTDLPNYNAIIEYAKDPNNELDIQYRGNYINIYYWGGSLLKLRGKGSIEFDAHYYYPPSKEFPISYIEALAHNDFRSKISKIKKLSQLSEEDLMKKRQEAITIIERIVSERDNVVNRLRSAKAESVSQILSEMKGVMKNWKECKSRNAIDERTVQHYISLFNKENAADSDFIVIDLEYALSENAGYCIPTHQKNPNEKQPRIDIIAIEKKTGQLYVLELKYGERSLENEAGLWEHYVDYTKSVGADDKWKSFLIDIYFLVNAQKKDGTLSDKVTLIETKPKFGFIFKPEKSNDEYNAFRNVLGKHPDLSAIMTIFLPLEENYDYPNATTHLLKKP